MLTFGSASSAGIYDHQAKLIKDLATRMSGADKRMINQILDDCVICGPEGDGSVNQFYDAYRTVADIKGVSLADETDEDKAFRATHRGKYLEFCTI